MSKSTWVSVSEIRAFFATAAEGTEPALHDELKELGLKGVRPNNGGIPFQGTPADGWRVCLHTRVASRVLLLLARFPVPDREALYAAVGAVDWAEYLTHRHTLAVACVCNGSRAFSHSGMPALVVKDAIVDQLRARTGNRPSVDRADPDVRVFLHIGGDRAALYLDLAGAQPLGRRSYRTEAGEAPLREPLAAAILRLAQWDRQMPLIDPMCGSGTLPIEAAMWARNLAPGLPRERFGFERWASFDATGQETLRRLCGEARAAVLSSSPRIVAADHDPAMVDIARANARRAGVRLAFRCQALERLDTGGEPRFVVLNPPYDERLPVDPDACRRIMTALSRLHGCRVAMITALPEYRRVMSQEPVLCLPLRNGALDSRLLVWDIP